MSKTIKITANKKNRNENGIRAAWLGSNPHSNGDDFSRSAWVRIISAWAAQKVRVVKISANNEANNMIFMERE